LLIQGYLMPKSAVKKLQDQIKAESIAVDLINGKTQREALLNVGYKDSTASHRSNEIIGKSGSIVKFLEDYRQETVPLLLGNLKKMSSALSIPDSSPEGWQKVIEDKNFNKMYKLMKLSVSVTQDLLDRQGYGKINKSMSVKKTINSRDLRQADKEIQELESRLQEQEGITAVKSLVSLHNTLPDNGKQAVQVNPSRAKTVLGKDSMIPGIKDNNIDASGIVQPNVLRVIDAQ